MRRHDAATGRIVSQPEGGNRELWPIHGISGKHGNRGPRRSSMEGNPQIRPISARSTVAAQRLTQDYARSFCTMKTGTARVFLRLDRPPAREPARCGLQGSPLVRQNRTKRKMSAYSSDLERFVERTPPINYWPV